jgi:hypothetical protein
MTRAAIIAALFGCSALCGCALKKRIGNELDDDGSGTGSGEAPSDGATGSSGTGGGTEEPSPPGFPVPDPDCPGCYLVNTDLAGDSSTEIFLSTYAGSPDGGSFLQLFDGEQWSTIHSWGEFDGLRCLWGNAEIGLFGIAREGDSPPSVRYFDVASGTLEDLGVPGEAVWGAGADDVFVMSESTVFHYDGSEWVDQELGSSELIHIDGTAGDNVFVLRADTSLLHYDGLEWSTIDVNLDVELGGLWVESSESIYSQAGSDHPEGITGPGLIAHYDGTGWTVVQEAPDDALLAITGLPNGPVYAVGATRNGRSSARAVVWHYDGESWQRHMLEDVRAFLWDAHCVPTGECYASGTSNTVLALNDL